MKRSVLMLLFLFAFGFFIRVFLANMADARLLWDMKVFHDMAAEMAQGNLAVNCCVKAAGYPLFLSVIYRLFGSDNLAAVRVVQIVLDLATGGLLFLLARKYFDTTTALVSAGLYLLNPFTASFTGLRLSEILTIFLLTCTVFLLHLKTIRTKKRHQMLLGFLFGLLLFVRVQFLFFAFVFPLLLWKKRVMFLVLFFCGFLLASSYSLIGYYKQFGRITLTPPYGGMMHSMYLNFYNTNRYHELTNDFPNIDPEYTAIAIEYYHVPVQEIPTLEAKYRRLLQERLKTEWPLFLTNMLHNMVWMWDKKHLFTYTDPWYPSDTVPLQILNGVSIVLSLFGTLMYIKNKKRAILGDPVFLFSSTLFLYVTVLFSLVTNETRLTIALYSLIYLWAGYGLVVLLHAVQNCFPRLQKGL